MVEHYKLNFPIETKEAQKFWASELKLNRIKAIIAFSLDLKNANDNLRRFKYYRQFRKKALKHFGKYVNQPDMKNIPFSQMKDKWWNEMPYS
jgi:hypothetical protein